jgi:hypothetical protein
VTAQYDPMSVQSVLRDNVPKSASKAFWLGLAKQLDLLGLCQRIKQIPAQAMFERTSAILKTNLDICRCRRLVESVAADPDSGDIRPTPASSSTSLQSWFLSESHAIVVEESPLSFQSNYPFKKL